MSGDGSQGRGRVEGEKSTSTSIRSIVRVREFISAVGEYYSAALGTGNAKFSYRVTQVVFFLFSTFISQEKSKKGENKSTKKSKMGRRGSSHSHQFAVPQKYPFSANWATHFNILYPGP